MYSKGFDNVFYGVLRNITGICELCNNVLREICNRLNIIFRKELNIISLFERKKASGGVVEFCQSCSVYLTF